jgi:hypothetical protein
MFSQKAQEIVEIGSPFQKREEPQTYCGSQLLYINDINGTVYTDGRININFNSLRDKYVNLSKAMLNVQVKVTNATATNWSTAATAVAPGLSHRFMKTDIISGVSCQFTNGLNINHQNLMLVNFLRKIMDTPKMDLETQASDLLLTKHEQGDKANRPPFALTEMTLTSIDKNEFSVSLTVTTTGILTYSTAFDKGLLKAHSDMSVYWKTDASVPYYLIDYMIPLKDIDPLFEQFDFPMIGWDGIMTFYLSKDFYSGASGSLWKAYNGYTSDGASAGALGVPVADAGIVPVIPTTTPCRLYYYDEPLSPASQEAYYKLMKGGGQMVRKYSEWVNPYLYQYLGNTSTTITDLVALNIQKPKRMFVCQSGAGLYASQLTPQFFQQRFTNFNVQINDKNLFVNPLQRSRELYDQFLMASNSGSLTPSGGKSCPITFKDWSTFYSFIALDLTKMVEQLPKDNTSVTIRMNAQSSALTRDVFYLTECERVVLFKFQEGVVSLVLGV